jgi:hypothetical protein
VGIGGKMKLGEVERGKTVTIAGREWDVLGKESGGILCLRHNIIGKKEFDEKNQNDWKKTTLRKYLNTDFLQELERNGVEPLTHISNLTTDDGLDDYGTSEDKVFLLTADQYRKYRKYISPEKDYWWLLTGDSTVNHGVRCVYTDGSLNSARACYGYLGVRPACVFPSSIHVGEEIATYELTVTLQYTGTEEEKEEIVQAIASAIQERTKHPVIREV